MSYTKIVDGVRTEMTEEEVDEIKRTQKEYERAESSRPLTDSEVFRLFAAQSINVLSVDDNTSLRMISYYPTWEELCTREYQAELAGFKFQYAGKLYETVQPSHTFQSQWVPGAEGTAAIYSRVEWQHAGTVDDPIPVPDTVPPESFTYVVGKVYDEDGVLYLCKFGDEPEGTEHSFPYKPSQNPTYFVKVE